MAECHTSSLYPSSIPQLWKHMYWEHANCCMYVRCVSRLAFTMPVLFFGTIECSSRKQQTLSSGPAVLSPCPLVACCWMFMVMLSFYSRTRGLGNQASCVGLSRTTLTTTSAPPLGKWQCVSFLTSLFLANISNSTNENWSQLQKFSATLV